MIRICKICGNEFIGRANREICSEPCKKEYRRLKAAEYKERNPKKVKARQRAYWNKTHKFEELKKIEGSDNIALDVAAAAPPDPKLKRKPKPLEHKKIATDSKWAKKYAEADRLTKIAMLSWALDKLGIAHLSYGQLSTKWLTNEYYSLLQQVLDRAKEEAI